ncbi:MAG: CpsB/CapC family capsule biosynthesis tyrosine phosphatase [Longimicrobiales bacterium]
MTHRDPTALVDIHNHLVPGVDDGARDVRAVVESVERMTRASIRRIITTPHIDGSLTLDSARLEIRLSAVTAAWERAAAAVGEAFPEVEFKRGHEVCVDVPEVDLSDPRIRLAGTSFVLVEWPRLQLPPATVRTLTRIRSAGYRPIVAHPERYAGMGQAIGVAGQWRDAGAYLQVNYGSLVGRYGPEAQRVAVGLLERGWVDYLSSDFHGHSSLKIYRDEAWAVLVSLGAEEVLHYLCRTNPGRVLSDDPPLPVPVLPNERRFWARVKGLLQRSTA